jgi:hypothetical protein
VSGRSSDAGSILVGIRQASTFEERYMRSSSFRADNFQHMCNSFTDRGKDHTSRINMYADSGESCLGFKALKPLKLKAVRERDQLDH